jgi:hypothetical protein
MHDWVIMSLASLAKEKVIYIDESLMLYRRHDNTVTGRFKEGLLAKLVNVIKYRASLAKTLLNATGTRGRKNV